MYRIWLFIAALSIVFAACGTDEGATSSVPSTLTTASTATADAAFPVTITTPTGDVTIEAMPERIVSLSATATESLFAIGAGGQLVAVDDVSNFPEGVPQTDLNGFTVTAESLAVFDPDLVVYFFDPGDLASGLAALDIPAIFQPAPVTLDEALVQIDQLGTATGRGVEASTLTSQMQKDIDAIYEAADGAASATYYYELDETLFSVTSSTFVGGLFAPLGLENIADPADSDGFGYPQLSAEFIIAEDPGLIFLADTRCCGQNVETVGRRPGWDRLTAVRAGSIVELDDDVASRWGPRIVELLQTAADAVSRLQES